MEVKYLGEKGKRVHAFGKKAGFMIAFLIFNSMLFFILSRLDKLPDYVKYWHSAGAAVLLSLSIFIAKGLKNE